ncbi:mandelate racemase/muconate lactonizing enzyme family protein [Planomicrobium sp. CPCC 101079]|uniref:mandelate racemase/muconate lactonizing enzyme family protein n=1 Tax=Planomicrobium sp. CPCC 101079 TaxID=2599618 RepID=UPI0011B432FC|nr:mandelate racemase/muconate lactonizing enzyme family protein [Planomicrobium sp. CPCC 101079]TWT01771.1 mandelate racemase/muconate lactonizing enzyme family protein [Planomicrobium sp. CPCC 101079]
MKVADIKVYILKSALPQPFAFSQEWVTQRSSTIVEIVTDEGLSGWGEALSAGLQQPEISAATIEKVLKPLVLGKDPLHTEVIWDEMYHHTKDYGRKGAVIGAISAIDIALWDLKGKILKQPICNLLGGVFRKKVQAYATGFFRTQGQGEKKRLAEEASNHAANGFELMKVKLGFGIQDDIEVMNEIRQAVGDKVELMIDVNHAYSVSEAIKLGRALENFNLRWFEEPVIPEDIKGYQMVKNRIDVPIAGGEAEFTAFGFRDLLESRAVDFAQPDICIAGGFTACKQIAAIAAVHGIQVNPHVWGTAIGQNASLHFLTSIPLANRSLFAQEPIFEYDTSSHPFRTDLAKNPIEHENGWVTVPEGDGLGLEINRDFLNENSVIYR